MVVAQSDNGSRYQAQKTARIPDHLPMVSVRQGSTSTNPQPVLRKLYRPVEYLGNFMDGLLTSFRSRCGHMDKKWVVTLRRIS